MRLERVGILLILAMGCTGGRDGLDLRLNLEEGQTFALKMVIDQEYHQDFRGRKLGMTQRTGVGYTFSVESVEPDGNAWVKSAFEWVSMNQESPMGNVGYDSANPPEEIPLMAKGAAALLGKSITVLLAPKGTVLEVKGLDALVEAVLKEIDIPEGPEIQDIEKQLKDQVGDEALKEMMRNMLAHYPDDPVEVGDSWDHKVVIAKGFPMIVETTYTLRERKDGTATIDDRSTIRSNPDAAPVEMGMAPRRYEISGTQEGHMTVDEATGMTLGAEITQKFDGQIVFEGARAAGGEDQGLPISAKSTVTIGPLEK